MKRFLGLFSLLLVTFLLTGCLSPSVKMTIEPSSIIVKKDTQVLDDIVVKVKPSGFSTKYLIDTALIEILDGDGQPVCEFTKEIGMEIIIVPLVIPTRPIPVPEIKLETIYKELHSEYTPDLYDDVLKGEKFTLKVILTGTKTSETTAEILFK